MSLKDMIGNGRPLSVSFEFSPPKTDEAEAALWAAIKRLEPLQPGFVSVTYGAGGSTRERTHATVKRIVEETSPQTRRAFDLRGRLARRDRRDRAGLLGRRHPPYRGAARRHARHGRDRISRTRKAIAPRRN